MAAIGSGEAAGELAPDLTSALVRAGVNATALAEGLKPVIESIGKPLDVTQGAQEVLNRKRAALAPTLADLVTAMRSNDGLSAAQHARVTKTANALAEADHLWPEDAASNPKDWAETVRKLLTDAAVAAGELTLARQLSDELRGHKPGESVDLNRYLGGQVPLSGRPAILDWLCERGNLVTNGVVDRNQGRVYRLPKRLFYRAWRFPGAPLASFAMSVAVLLAAAAIAKKAGDKSHAAFLPWLVAYGAVLLGVALHFLSAVIRRRRRVDAGAMPVISAEVPVVSKWWQWLTLRPLATAGFLVSPLITVFVLRLLDYPVGLGKPKEMLTYVLAGYSADSLAMVASTRLADLAGVVQKDLKAKIGA